MRAVMRRAILGAVGAAIAALPCLASRPDGGGAGTAALLRAEQDVTARLRTRAGAQAGRMAIPIPDIDGDCPGLGIVAGRLASKARLVGLGEGTHGTAEFNRFRFSLFRRLVERHGFTHLLLEDTLWSTAPLEEFIQGRGDGDPEAEMSRLMWPWCNRDMADFLRWARGYNAAQPEAGRVHLIGIDIQKPYRQTRHLAELRRKGGQPIEGIEALERIADAMPKADPLDFREFANQQSDPATPGRWRRVDAELGAWGQRMAGDLTHEETSLLNAIRCGIALELNQDGVAIRDQGMALQILEVMGRLPADAKAAFWAHGAHVSHNAPESGFPYAGSILRDRLGEGYATLVCLSERGTVTAKDGRLFAQFQNADGTFKAGTPDIRPGPMVFRVPADFIENVFAKRVTQGVVFTADWLADAVTREFLRGRVLECGGIGATFDPSWSGEDRMPFRAESFDAVFFMRVSSAAENLRFPAKAASGSPGKEGVAGSDFGPR